MKRHLAMTLAALLVCLLGGCDQSVNYSTLDESKLTGKHCSAKTEQERSCKAGDVVVTVAGREQLLCDWGWQIVHEPASNEVLCVYRGSPRESRSL
jgi:hypothetical protein